MPAIPRLLRTGVAWLAIVGILFAGNPRVASAFSDQNAIPPTGLRDATAAWAKSSPRRASRQGHHHSTCQRDRFVVSDTDSELEQEPESDEGIPAVERRSTRLDAFSRHFVEATLLLEPVDRLHVLMQLLI